MNVFSLHEESKILNMSATVPADEVGIAATVFINSVDQSTITTNVQQDGGIRVSNNVQAGVILHNEDQRALLTGNTNTPTITI